MDGDRHKQGPEVGRGRRRQAKVGNEAGRMAGGGGRRPPEAGESGRRDGRGGGAESGGGRRRHPRLEGYLRRAVELLAHGEATRKSIRVEVLVGGGGQARGGRRLPLTAKGRGQRRPEAGGGQRPAEAGGGRRRPRGRMAGGYRRRPTEATLKAASAGSGPRTTRRRKRTRTLHDSQWASTHPAQAALPGRMALVANGDDGHSRRRGGTVGPNVVEPCRCVAVEAPGP